MALGNGFKFIEIQLLLVKLLNYLREHAPTIIFMDEIDSIGSARMDSGGDSEV